VWWSRSSGPVVGSAGVVRCPGRGGGQQQRGVSDGGGEPQDRHPVALRAQPIPAAGGGLLHYPPVLRPRDVVISARYLSEAERVVIANLHRAGVSAQGVAAELGRSPSTVSRELARNTGPGRRYGAGAAQARAVLRRGRPRARRVERDVVLRVFVTCGGPRSRNPFVQPMFRSRRWRSRRRPHRHPDARWPARHATPMVMIEDRPASVADSVNASRPRCDGVTRPHPVVG
jgi:hypothetical protein